MYIDNEMSTLSDNHSCFGKPEDRNTEIVYTLAGKPVRLSDTDEEGIIALPPSNGQYALRKFGESLLAFFLPSTMNRCHCANQIIRL